MKSFQEGSDVVVAWMTSSNIPVVTDRFIFSTTPFNVPVDVTNNVRVKELTQDEGLLKFTFSRDIDTGVRYKFPLVKSKLLLQLLQYLGLGGCGIESGL